MKSVFSILFTLFIFTSIAISKDDGNLIQSSISSPLNYVKQDFDVISYNAVLKFIDLQNKLLQANNEVTVNWTNRTDTSKFYFHLRGLTVDSVFYDGSKINFLKVGDTVSSTFHYEVTPPKENLNDTAKVKIYYSGAMTNEGKLSPWGGVHYDDSLLYSLGIGFLNNYVGTTQHWLACYDHPSDKAKFKIKFIVPTGNFVASGGTYTVTYPDNGTDEFDYSIDYPTSPDVLTFNIGKLEEVKFEGADIPISIFADHQDTSAVRYAFQLVPEMVNYFESIFGNYPFTKVGYALTKKGSMESQEMINFYKPLVWSAYSKKDSTNLTAAHELSHMWLGDAVTPYDFRDAWLNESWATFSESLWREHLGGFNSYLYEQENKMNLYFNNIVKIEGVIPLYDFVRNSSTSNYPTTIYYKGADVVGMLRYLIGDSVFFSGMKGFIKKYKYINMNSQNLQRIFEQYSGKKLDEFFNQWVYSPGWPKVKATLIYNDVQNSEYISESIKLEQIKTDGWGYDKAGYFLNFPIEVTFKRKDGSQRDTVVWMNGDIKLIPLNNEPVYSTIINKGSHLRTLMQVTSINYEKAVSVEHNLLDNLAKHFLYNRILNLNFAKTGSFEVKVYNLYGSEMICQNFNGMQDLQIDLNSLLSGFYSFIVINDGKIIYSNKIILN